MRRNMGYRTNQRVATVAATTALAFGGCGGSKEKAPSLKEAGVKSAEVRTNAKTLSPRQEAERGNPTLKALNIFRDSLYFRRKAKVLGNTCVGWMTPDSNFTVTYQPGYARENNAGRQSWFSVFSASDEHPSSRKVLNGAPGDLTVGGDPIYWGRNVNFYYKFEGGKAKEVGSRYQTVEVNDIVVNPKLTDKNGQEFYTEKGTDKPLINTVVLALDQNTQELLPDICVALSKGSPLPPKVHRVDKFS